MPATLPITRAQISALNEILQDSESDAIFQELPPTTLGQPVEVWVLDENSRGTQHRNVIIEEDGTVVSDMVVDD